MNRICFLITLVFLTGCAASGPPFTNEDSNDVNKSTVYIYRVSDKFQQAGWPNIFVNGEKVFALKNGGYGVLYIQKGKYSIEARGSMLTTNWVLDDGIIELNAAPNETYYIQMKPVHRNTSVTNDIIVTVRGHAQFLIKSKEEALSEIKTTVKVN